MENETWEIWSECHCYPDQQKRFESATLATCTPVHIDKKDMFAYFQSKRGKYETFLDTCTCTDFARHGLQCKHMYRLALELQLMEGKYYSYSHGGYDWKQAIEIIESLPELVQHEFYNHFNSCYGSIHPYRRKKCLELDFLISKGILVDYPEKETEKFRTVHLIEDFMVDRQKLRRYLSRKFNPPTYFNGVEMVPDDLPEDEVTLYLRERGFIS
jgi:hypothetical protein